MVCRKGRRVAGRLADVASACALQSDACAVDDVVALAALRVGDAGGVGLVEGLGAGEAQGFEARQVS